MQMKRDSAGTKANPKLAYNVQIQSGELFLLQKVPLFSFFGKFRFIFPSQMRLTIKTLTLCGVRLFFLYSKEKRDKRKVKALSGKLRCRRTSEAESKRPARER